MGDFSRNTFDKLKHYVSVRLQQGVPLVDADWNEQDDLRRYELQAFLKWFVGNGVPKGNDGFRILAISDAENTFAIQGGDSTSEHAGRCLVEGWDIINETTLAYTVQPLFNHAELAAVWHVVPLPPLTTPAQDRTDRVFVDVWEREVDSVEDDHLVNPVIGVETSVRAKREWVVRVAEGMDIPAPPLGHMFYHLADLHRRAGKATIDQADITDHRLTGLAVASYHDMEQTIRDAFGASYVLDHDGQPNLKLSLRDAINALLRGGLPSTPELSFGESQASPEHPAAIADAHGNIWVFWVGSVFTANGVWYNRYHRASATWEKAVALSATEASDTHPSALVDRQGDIWVFWQRGITDLWYSRYRSALEQWEDAKRLTTGGSGNQNQDVCAVVDREGRHIWAFWVSNRRGNFDIWYNRYRLNTNTWENDQLLPESSTAKQDIQPFALADRTGDIWLFWNSGNDIWVGRFRGGAATWETTQLTITNDTTDQFPHACEDQQGNIWLFWQSTISGNVDILYRLYQRDRDRWGSVKPLTTETGNDEQPFAFVDRRGDIWVMWHSNRSGNSALWYNRLRADGGWDRAIQLTGTGRTEDHALVALESQDGDIWVFWQRQGRDDHDIWYRTLIPIIDTDVQQGQPLIANQREGSVSERLTRLENLLTVVPGDIVDGSDSGSPLGTTLAKIAELTAMRPGSYRVVTYHTNPATGSGRPAASGIASRVYVNDVPSPQSLDYQTTSTSTRLLKGADTITVDAGDKIQLYARKVLANNASAGVIGAIEIAIGNPIAPAVKAGT